MALTAYIQQTRRLLHDPAAQAYSDADVTAYINLGRKLIALQSQSIRHLLSGGAVISLTLTSGGSGYTTPPTVSVVGVGQLAQVTAQIQAGAVIGLTLVRRGWGYVTGATLSFSGGGGSGAAGTATIDNSASTVTGQETYDFATLDILAQTIAGVGNVFAINTIAAQWGQGSVYKPTLSRKTWTEFQAYYRINANQYVNFPAVWSQHKRGVNGNFFLFPLPGNILSMDIDAICIPIDLGNDQTPEALQLPWTDGVPYLGAYFAYNNSQRKEDADRMFKYYTQFMQVWGADVETPYTEEFYRDDI